MTTGDSHPQYNASLDKKQNICGLNRVNIFPKCSFLKYFSYLCGVRAAKRQTDNNRQFKEIIQIMATLVLQIPDESLVSKVKQACKMLMGVTSVKVQKDAKPKEYDVTKTAGYREAMDDVKHGRVTHYDSLKDFYKEMGL